MATTKYLIFSVIFFGYAMFSYNRKGVSFIIPRLLADGFENHEVGLILSSQNLAYAISKFLGGILSDKLSSRILFSSGLLISGLAAIIFSSVESLPLFTLAWFLNGLAQGVGWPAIAKLLKYWFDPAELGVWWSMASASANVSGCIAPFLASYIIINFGWRFSLVFVGGLTLVAAMMSYMLIVDSPESLSKTTSTTKASGRKTSSSKTDKTDKLPKKEVKSMKGTGMSVLLRSRFIWVISACYLVASTIKTCVTDWSQMYLMKDRHQSSLVASSFISCVEFGGFFGGILAGYLSDLYMKQVTKGGEVKPARGNPRMMVALGFAMILGVCLHLFYFNVSESTPAIFINQIGILIGASVYGQIAIFGVVATQSVVSEISGTSHAIAALAANLGSILAGLPVATIAKMYSWSGVFYVLEIVTIATIAFMIVMRNVSYQIKTAKMVERKTK